MSKKVLVLSASPRRGGNSDTLCERFMLGAKEAGNQSEKIFLGDFKINYCTGCGSCFNNHKCSQQDDMAGVLAKMVAADVIVMATPVYFYSMDAQMKTLIDRCCPRYSEISGKDIYFILTAADSDEESMQRTVEGLRGFTSCLTDATEKGIIYGLGVWNMGEIEGNKAMDEAYEMGKAV